MIFNLRNIGKDCSYVLDNVNKSCSRNDADFVKLSLFTAYFKVLVFLYHHYKSKDKMCP